jgi:hypothetical protein
MFDSLLRITGKRYDPYVTAVTVARKAPPVVTAAQVDLEGGGARMDKPMPRPCSALRGTRLL